MQKNELCGLTASVAVLLRVQNNLASSQARVSILLIKQTVIMGRLAPILLAI